jgi:MoaA/NifB/PqqE/SkfB family radical SAM enzyme
MFKFEDLKSIHIELTTNCQARCPMCSRNIHSGVKNPLLKIVEWTLEDFKNIINDDVLNTIDRIYFCGNFGDPMLHDDLIEMCRYVSQTSPKTAIGVHTNGGARKPEWWAELARALPEDHCVYFALDGLADTHSLYRVGVEFDKVIENAKAFINAGGRAEWTFIKFKHNEHQVEECRALAKEYGFQQFMVKNTSRFLVEPKYDVWDKDMNTTFVLEPPSDTKTHFLPREVINDYKTALNEAEITCHVQGIKEIYIDGYKTVLPCCWVNPIPYTYYDPAHVNDEVVKVMRDQYNKMIADFGGIDNLDANNGLRNIIDSKTWQTIWQKKWNEEKMVMCARVCGKFKSVDISQPNEQFIEGTEL